METGRQRCYKYNANIYTRPCIPPCGVTLYAQFTPTDTALRRPSAPDQRPKEDAHPQTDLAWTEHSAHRKPLTSSCPVLYASLFSPPCARRPKSCAFRILSVYQMTLEMLVSLGSSGSMALFPWCSSRLCWRRVLLLTGRWPFRRVRGRLQ